MLEDLLAKYDRPVPRYTSYPTAPHFTPAVDAAVESGWLRALGTDPVSLYLHVPFCASLCSYCGCHTAITRRRDPIERFRDALLDEIALTAELIGRRQPVSHLHWGGGTPNSLEPRDLRALMARLRDRFDLAPASEIAIELDPRTLTPDKIAGLGECGFTRASLGVQDFDAAVQAAINREQPYELVADAVEALRAVGIAGINFDLMYGLPLQTEASVARSADLAADLAPDRIALFGYAHVPWMKRHQKLLECHPMPDGSARWRQAEIAAERLEARGYVRIGLDHFARPDDSLATAQRQGRLRRNFQGYTTDAAATLIGFGPSAISRLPQGFTQNATGLPDWSAAVAEGRRAAARGCTIAEEDRVRAAVIERIMCHGEIDLAAFPGDFTAELAASERLAADGLLLRDGSRIALTPRGRPLVRTVAALFDRYLANGAGRHSRAV